jgi:osmotically-inducible protein OsmY
MTVMHGNGRFSDGLPSTITPDGPRGPGRGFRSALRLGWALAIVGALSACAPLPLVVGSAMFGGALVATDRRSSGAQIDDQAIEIKGATRLREQFGERAHFNVTSYNRWVLLTGEAGSEADLQAAVATLSRIDNVRSVLNEAALIGISSAGSRSNDLVIAGKVKAALVGAKDLSATAIKVVTERSVVYLMGRVTERESARAVDVARGVSGVAKVVQAFEIISEAELAELVPSARPAPGPAGSNSPNPQP